MLERFLRSGKKNIEYNIIITDQFVDEFEEICNYISYTLKNINQIKKKKTNNKKIKFSKSIFLG